MTRQRVRHRPVRTAHERVDAREARDRHRAARCHRTIEAVIRVDTGQGRDQVRVRPVRVRRKIQCIGARAACRGAAQRRTIGKIKVVRHAATGQVLDIRGRERARAARRQDRDVVRRVHRERVGSRSRAVHRVAVRLGTLAAVDRRRDHGRRVNQVELVVTVFAGDRRRIAAVEIEHVITGTAGNRAAKIGCYIKCVRLVTALQTREICESRCA